jgi:uncharacterized protein (DUF1697 family)
MTYIALLKGINVGGNHLIKMDALKKMFENMGFKNVRTLLQSGNVIFESAKAKPEAIQKKVEAHLEKALGYSVAVVIRTMDEIEKIIADYPFAKIKDHENCKVFVSFLDGSPDQTGAKELISLSSKNEIYHIKDMNVYLLCKEKSFLDSLMSKNIVEKKLRVKATTRNWATVNKLVGIK